MCGRCPCPCQRGRAAFRLSTDQIVGVVVVSAFAWRDNFFAYWDSKPVGFMPGKPIATSSSERLAIPSRPADEAVATGVRTRLSSIATDRQQTPTISASAGASFRIWRQRHARLASMRPMHEELRRHDVQLHADVFPDTHHRLARLGVEQVVSTGSWRCSSAADVRAAPRVAGSAAAPSSRPGSVTSGTCR